MIFGLILLFCGALLLIPLENWIHKQLGGAADFLAEHIYLPLARIIIVIGFLYCVFPSPLLHQTVVTPLNGQDILRPPLHTLINSLFLIGLAVPLLPRAQRYAGLILPVQTLIGAWLLIASLPVDVALPSSPKILLSYGLIIIVSHGLLRLAALQLAEHQRWDALSIYDSLILISQPPLVLWVTRALIVK